MKERRKEYEGRKGGRYMKNGRKEGIFRKEERKEYEGRKEGRNMKGGRKAYEGKKEGTFR